jgi:hypothetical protein
MSQHRRTPSFSRHVSCNTTREPRGYKAHRCVRKPLPVIDIGYALDLLAEAVKSRGQGYAYFPVWNTEANDATCLYARNEPLNCIVGEALAHAGARVEKLEGLCAHGIRDLHRDGRLAVTLTLGALVVLHTAQQSEESGSPWGGALEDATIAAVKFLELLTDAVVAASIPRSGLPDSGVTPEVVEDKHADQGEAS